MEPLAAFRAVGTVGLREWGAEKYGRVQTRSGALRTLGLGLFQVPGTTATETQRIAPLAPTESPCANATACQASQHRQAVPFVCSNCALAGPGQRRRAGKFLAMRGPPLQLAPHVRLGLLFCLPWRFGLSTSIRFHPAPQSPPRQAGSVLRPLLTWDCLSFDRCCCG